MKKLLLALLLLPTLGFSKPLNFLYIGDSHSVGPFGWAVDKHLRSIDEATVETYAVCGSVVNWFYKGTKSSICHFFSDQNASHDLSTDDKNKNIKTPLIEPIVERSAPDMVVVELGANYILRTDYDVVMAEMKKLAQMIHDRRSKCVWVSKPDGRVNKDKIAKNIEITKKAVSEFCTFFDSTKVTSYPATGGDGTHFWFNGGMKIAQNWADEVFKVVKKDLNLK